MGGGSSWSPTIRSPPRWPGRPSGPGTGEALAAEHDVQLVSTSVATIAHPGSRCALGRRRHAGRARPVVRHLPLPGLGHAGRPFLPGLDKVLVADVYDPFTSSSSSRAATRSDEAAAAPVAGGAIVLNEQLLRGDFFLCASEKQRDFWLGQLPPWAG